jgi:hypothetical protein
MSRTYRKRYKTDWLFKESVFDDCTYYAEHKKITFGSPEHKKLIARYRSDHSAGRFNAPKWFRKMLNQEFRSKNKMILRNLDSDVDPVFVKHRKNANWEWW